MEHEGICYRNSKHNPASAEEYQAADIARMLLLDDEGEYLGDDVAIFAGFGVLVPNLCVSSVYDSNSMMSPSSSFRASEAR
jgi:hypothetical protein